MKIIKRNGTEVPFEREKIIKAISKANNELIGNEKLSDESIIDIADDVTLKCSSIGHVVNVEEIQNYIEKRLMETGNFELAKKYITYRFQRELNRKSNTTDKQILSLIDLNNEEIKQENSNKNPTINSTQRDYMAGEISKDISVRLLLPPDIIAAHNQGLIHFHDMDYFAQRMHNCDLINLEDMLQNGTVISGTLIEKPKSFATACNITTQIVAQVASSQYGGQSFTLSHLAPFVDISRQKIRAEVTRELENIGCFSYENVEKIVETRLKEEIKHGVQCIQYQVVTLMTTNGQSPFVTVFMYLGEARNEQEKQDLALIIEEVLKQRIQGTKNEQGVWVTPAFPKLIMALEPDIIDENGKYHYLARLAAECTSKRMVPDYVSEKVMKELKEGNCFPSMGCRSSLSPWKDENENYKFYGRFNKGVVTINVIDAALSSKGNMEEFWKIFDERLELCHKALLCRYNRLKGTVSDVAPILWQHGAIARLKKGETIDKLLVGGYSTISLGYCGIWESVYYLTGHKLTEPEGKELAIKLLQYMNKKCDDWNNQLNLGFGIYGTPLESTTYKFAKCLQKRFGIIKGVTDHGYVTNSYHIHVTEEIDAFSKLSIESEFQSLSKGGAISYVEVPDMSGNIDAVLSVMKHIYNNIMYAELNCKFDYCQKCGFDGEIQIKEDENRKLLWECPHCGNRDEKFMNVARRTCGYIGSNFWNAGRTEEIRDRVLHL